LAVMKNEFGGEEDKALNDAIFHFWYGFYIKRGLPRALSNRKLDHSLKRGRNSIGGVANDVTKTVIPTVDAKTMRTQTELFITHHVSPPAKHEGIDSRHIMSHKIEKWKARQTQIDNIPRLV
jgi:hypothetical protein